MAFLITFLKRLFEIISWSNTWFQDIAAGFPSSLYSLKKELHLLNDKFVKYVVCPKCHNIYKFEDCYYSIEGRHVSKRCTFIKFPQHRQQWRRQECGTSLLKEVTLKNGSKRLYPHKVYCYQSLIKTLQTFTKRSGFTERCELWRNREVRSFAQVLCDVFDGRIWKDFQCFDGTPFLIEPRNYAFMLNVDWMQPFVHTAYSVGVIYLVLMNLPRSERFKRENVFLIGIIPGPCEPSLTINPYLSPLVDELLQLWNPGVALTHSGSPLSPQIFKAALLCVACDVPASRKICGFTSHASAAGCSKCKKKFKVGRIGEPSDYSGFEPCPRRQNDEHRRQAAEISCQTSQEDADKLTSLYGTRYTELYRLPYFDCVRFTIVDPMHNLFLGTAKRMLEIWLDEKHLDVGDLQAVQNVIDGTEAPSNIGRLPFKIAKSFAGFTAEQWKSWTTMFSLFALRNRLQLEHYQCWTLFVHACRILSTPMNEVKDVGTAHSLLVQFCKEFERLYGSAKVTPNMHLHTHLADCILDYGPVHSFWLFGFERYNGILGDYQTNNKSVEIQIFRKFLRDQHLHDLAAPNVYRENFEQIFKQSEQHNTATNIGQVDCNFALSLLQLREVDIVTGSELWFTVREYKCGPTHTVKAFDNDELAYVTKAYRFLNPEIPKGAVPVLFDRYSTVAFAGALYGSMCSRHKRSGNILAKWAGRYDDEIDPSSDVRPGLLQYFLKQAMENSKDSIFTISLLLSGTFGFPTLFSTILYCDGTFPRSQLPTVNC